MPLETKHSYLKINGNQLFYEQVIIDENRPTLVFLHDSLGCVQLWRDFPEKLAKATNCNIFSYDRLGYGKSDEMLTSDRSINYLEKEADVLAKIIHQQKLKNVILFGHSDGGSIALIFAAKHPNKIEKILVEAAHIFVEKQTLEGIETALNAYKHTSLPQKLQKYHGDKVEKLFDAWTKTWKKPEFQNWNIEYLLPQIKCPLLFIQGEMDEYGTINQVDQTVNLASGKSVKKIIPNAGHTPHKTHTDEVVKMAVDFISIY
ncbi:MAG: alpha/beta fold hydrolase [Bacteroidota bacterium]